MENPDPVLERRRLMWRLAIRLTRLLMEGYGPILEATGVTVSRDDVLMGLSVSQADLAGSPHNIASLAEIYGKSPATTMRWVDKFERVGVIYTTREGASRIIRVARGTWASGRRGHRRRDVHHQDPFNLKFPGPDLA